jgi:hypothetical protein
MPTYEPSRDFKALIDLDPIAPKKLRDGWNIVDNTDFTPSKDKTTIGNILKDNDGEMYEIITNMDVFHYGYSLRNILTDKTIQCSTSEIMYHYHIASPDEIVQWRLNNAK